MAMRLTDAQALEDLHVITGEVVYQPFQPGIGIAEIPRSLITMMVVLIVSGEFNPWYGLAIIMDLSRIHVAWTERERYDYLGTIH